MAEINDKSTILFLKTVLIYSIMGIYTMKK